MLRFLCCFVLSCVFVLGLAAPGNLQAQDEQAPSDDGAPPPNEEEENRFEVAPLPALAGNSDVGFIFGFFGSLARVGPAFDPYQFRLKLYATSSVMSEEGEAIFPFHRYVLLLDVPGLAGGKVRLLPELAFERISNSGFFGLVGSATSDPLSRLRLGGGRQYQYVRMFVRGSVDARIRIRDTGAQLLLGAEMRWMMPRVFPDSVLDEGRTNPPEGDPPLRGFGNHPLWLLRAGLLWDSRDDEVSPQRGRYHELSARWGAGLPEDGGFAYVGITADSRVFTPLIPGGWLTFATRLIFDAQVGEVPFYELAWYGTFIRYGFTGIQGVRGAPEGRHSGAIKAIGSAELRSMFLRFRVRSLPFQIGAFLALDVGHCFAGDGGPKGQAPTFGAGGGILIRWGQALMIRFDIEYSADSRDGGPPFGFYFALGHVY